MSTEIDLAAHIAAETEWRKNVTKTLDRIEKLLEATTADVRLLQSWRDQQAGAKAILGTVCSLLGGGVVLIINGVIEWWRR